LKRIFKTDDEAKRCDRCGKALTEQEVKKAPRGSFILRRIGVKGSYPVYCDTCKKVMEKKKKCM
jgi:hypothetical protein